MDFLSNLADSIPVVGHVKGLVHYAAGDTEGGNKAMYQATRTSAVLGAGAAGSLAGPGGAVAAAMYAGALTDTVATAAMDKPQGILKGCKNIADDVRDGKNPAGSILSTGFQVGMDGLGGLGMGGVSSAASNVTGKTVAKGAENLAKNVVTNVGEKALERTVKMTGEEVVKTVTKTVTENAVKKVVQTAAVQAEIALVSTHCYMKADETTKEEEKEKREEEARQRRRERREREERERREREERERREREERERREREERERRERGEREQRERERREREEREQSEREELQRAREEIERRAREEIERRAREEIERRAREVIERRAREEIVRREREQREQREREEMQEQERRAREQQERDNQEQAEREARERLLQRFKQQLQQRSASASNSGSQQPQGNGNNNNNNNKKPRKNKPNYFAIFMDILEEILDVIFGAERPPTRVRIAQIFRGLSKAQKDYLGKLIERSYKSEILIEVLILVIRIFSEHFREDISFTNFLSLKEFVSVYILEEISYRTEVFRMDEEITRENNGSIPKKDPKELRDLIVTSIMNLPDIVSTIVDIFVRLRADIESELMAFQISEILFVSRELSSNFRDVFSAIYHYFKHRCVPGDGVLSVREYYDWIRNVLEKLEQHQDYIDLLQDRSADVIRGNIRFEIYVPLFDRRIRIVITFNRNGDSLIIILSSCYILDNPNDDDEEGMVWIEIRRL